MRTGRRTKGERQEKKQRRKRMVGSWRKEKESEGKGRRARYEMRENLRKLREGKWRSEIGKG